jgi:aconitate hydratase 2/2-methylisocitrate dehydratase
LITYRVPAGVDDAAEVKASFLAEVGAVAATGLKNTLLMFDAFHDVADKAKAGNANAKAVMQSWADAEWFTSRLSQPAGY